MFGVMSEKTTKRWGLIGRVLAEECDRRWPDGYHGEPNGWGIAKVERLLRPVLGWGKSKTWRVFTSASSVTLEEGLALAELFGCHPRRFVVAGRK